MPLLVVCDFVSPVPRGAVNSSRLSKSFRCVLTSGEARPERLSWLSALPRSIVGEKNRSGREEHRIFFTELRACT
jgi:hypothetical protein